MQDKPSLFSRFHNKGFRWNDFFVIPVLLTFFLFVSGQIAGEIIQLAVLGSSADQLSPFMDMFWMYFSNIGVWIVILLYCRFIPGNRPILQTIGTKPKGNSLKLFGIGLLIGFGMNGLCILAAWLNRDIHLSFSSVSAVPILLLFAAVLVQSSAEELSDRCFLYQRIRRGYRSPWFAILLSSAVFALMHGLNPGVTFSALLDIFISGLLFSMFVYYYDSLWCAFGIHTAWNYTQNVIFGLPNSGFVSAFSIFQLDAASARASFAYDPSFGIEGTFLSILVQAIGCVLVWYFGSKRKHPSLNPWAEQESRSPSAS